MKAVSKPIKRPQIYLALIDKKVERFLMKRYAFKAIAGELWTRNYLADGAGNEAELLVVLICVVR